MRRLEGLSEAELKILHFASIGNIELIKDCLLREALIDTEEDTNDELNLRAEFRRVGAA